MKKSDNFLFIFLLVIFILLTSIILINKNLIIYKFLTKLDYKTKKVNIERLQGSVINQKYEYLLFNPDNKPVIDEKFDNIQMLSNEKFLVKKDNLFGVIDKNGKYIIPLKYTSLHYDLREKRYFASTKIFQYFLDDNGKVIIQAKKIDKQHEFYVVKNDDGISILDFNLNKISYFPSASSLRITDKNAEGIVVYYKNSKKIITDLKGKEILPSFCDNAEYLLSKDGRKYFRVRKKGYLKGKSLKKDFYGVVDDQNRIIVPVVFNYIRKYNDILQGSIRSKDKAGYVFASFDLDGNFIENPDINIRENNNSPGIIKVSEAKNKDKQQFTRVSKEQIDDLITNIKFIDQYPEKQPVHKTNYKSDFNNKKLHGKFVKLICSESTYLCNLSQNGLSAKYSGIESYYIADKSVSSGKYYLEFQIDSRENQDYTNTFALIHFPEYKNETDEKRYIHSWKFGRNKYEIKIPPVMTNNSQIIGIAMDFDNLRLYNSVNGEWKQNPYDTNEGLKIMASHKNKDFYPAFSIAGYKDILTVNFGRQAFKYNIPEGYTAFDNRRNINADQK